MKLSKFQHLATANQETTLSSSKFSNVTITISKSTVRKYLNDASYQSIQSILASERIFLARNNKEWLDVTSLQ